MYDARAEAAAKALHGANWREHIEHYDDVDAAYWNAFWVGLGVGARAVGNGAIDTAWGFVTLGYGEPLEVFDTSGEGYATSYMFARGGFELLAGLGLGAAAGAPGKLGKAALAWDVAGNGSSVGRGISGVVQDGELNFQDGVQIIGGGFGLAGNFSSAMSKTAHATGRIGSIVGHSIPGELNAIQKATIISKVEALIGDQIRIVWGAAENGFDPITKKIYLVGTEAGPSARGAFMEELQHRIDDFRKLTPDPIPKKGTLENALFHREVFERMANNSELFGISEKEAESLIEWITIEIWELGG